MTKLENLPVYIIQRILEFFQTKKYIQFADLDEYQRNKLISQRRKLINIRTDLPSILNLSMTNRYFNDLLKGPVGKLLLTVHYNSTVINDDPLQCTLQHISHCPELNCMNICHYINKDTKHTKYTGLIKKIALKQFEILTKNKQFKGDIVLQYKAHLTNKQIESYYRIKKMDKKLKEYEKTKSCKSSELDSISLDSDSE